VDNFVEGERLEMIELYRAKGLAPHDAECVIDTLLPYKDAFLDLMMVMELGLMPEAHDAHLNTNRGE
jgi:vacuolar iron transporter family protein